ncbi:DUF995 domain-containing protein [Mesorhizobium sp.]|uniref:DUF995 domain-containing protein n=1 Tax=Mesorhizobium sp. TaxID=1871066 RepID=UPI001227A21F|nr:DUF995 domain-containing protein [Mesorhizobium sp.]TIS49133.1 MAG: DUF995 domain-containing protein [Mesorhizobium sp.]
MKALTLSVLIAGLATTPALSETMPKGAAPVTSADISSMFEGKTYTFKEKAQNGKTVNISWFLGADGKMLGYTGNGPSFAVGTWTASDGKLCVSNKWKGSWGESTSGDCQLWARDTKNPKKLYRAEISKGGDYTAYKPSLKAGDSISKEIEALKRKLK